MCILNEAFGQFSWQGLCPPILLYTLCPSLCMFACLSSSVRAMETAKKYHASGLLAFQDKSHFHLSVHRQRKPEGHDLCFGVLRNPGLLSTTPSRACGLPHNYSGQKDQVRPVDDQVMQPTKAWQTLVKTTLF